MNVQPIIDALDAAVEARGVAFGDAQKPKNATTRYVVAWFDAGNIGDRTLRSRDDFSTVAVFHAYGQTKEAARGANGLLTEAILSLFGQTVGDRVLMKPYQLTSRPIDRDDNLNPPLYDAITEWRFPTSPV